MDLDAELQRAAALHAERAARAERAREYRAALGRLGGPVAGARELARRRRDATDRATRALLGPPRTD